MAEQNADFHEKVLSYPEAYAWSFNITGMTKQNLDVWKALCKLCMKEFAFKGNCENVIHLR